MTDRLRRRLDRLEATTPAVEADTPAEIIADAEVILSFMHAAKAYGHDAEFDALDQALDEAREGHDLPHGLVHRRDWYRQARPVQLPPVGDWPTPEQVTASEDRLREMLDTGAQEPEGGWGAVDVVLARALDQQTGQAQEPRDGRERWEALVAERITARV